MLIYLSSESVSYLKFDTYTGSVERSAAIFGLTQPEVGIIILDAHEDDFTSRSERCETFHFKP